MIQEDKLKEAQRLYETANADQRYVLERLFPELKESEDERTRQEIVRFIRMEVEDEIVGNKWLAWIEKQKEFVSADFDDVWETADCDELTAPLEKYSKDAIKKMCHAWYDKGIELERKNWIEKQGEQKPYERKDFISIPFGAFDSELVNETITIPDGCVATIEGNKIHIKKKDNSAIEAIKLNHTVDNNEMVESNFKVGDWVVRTNGDSFCNGSKFAQIQSIELDGEMCYFDTGRWLYPSEIRLWTINDAQDGDLIYVSTEEKGIGAIFNRFDNGIIYFHCYLSADFTQGGYMPMGDVELIYPWQEIHHQKFFQKMKEAGYEWDSEKKELIRRI